jgi:hypothetical protein
MVNISRNANNKLKVLSGCVISLKVKQKSKAVPLHAMEALEGEEK